MPKYEVLHPIEKGWVLHVAKGDEKYGDVAMSGSDGKAIPVDKSGVVELTVKEAEAIVHGQLRLHNGKPDPIDGPARRDLETSTRLAAEAEQKKKNDAEYEEFVAFRTAKAKKTNTAQVRQEAREEAAIDRAAEDKKEDAAAAKAEKKK
jgi:hypothetical protein